MTFRWNFRPLIKGLQTSMAAILDLITFNTERVWSDGRRKEHAQSNQLPATLGTPIAEHPHLRSVPHMIPAIHRTAIHMNGITQSPILGAFSGMTFHGLAWPRDMWLVAGLEAALGCSTYGWSASVHHKLPVWSHPQSLFFHPVSYLTGQLLKSLFYFISIFKVYFIF